MCVKLVLEWFSTWVLLFNGLDYQTTHCLEINSILFNFHLIYFEELSILCTWVHWAIFRHTKKRASDSFTDGCEPLCVCLVLNSESLEELSVLLSTEPSLQPLNWILNEYTCSLYTFQRHSCMHSCYTELTHQLFILSSPIITTPV